MKHGFRDINMNHDQHVSQSLDAPTPTVLRIGLDVADNFKIF